MKKFLSVFVSAMLLAIAIMPINLSLVSAANITYGEEMFAYAGMDGYFDATSDTRNVPVNAMEKIAAGGWDSGAKLVKNTTDNKTYLRLAKYGNHGSNSNFSSIFTEMGIANIATDNFIKYTIKFRLKGTDPSTGGFGFALGGGDNRVGQVELTGINSGELVEQDGWITYVSEPIALSKDDLTPRNTLDMWFNTDGKTTEESYLEIDSISVGRSTAADGTYEENYPHADFTAYAVAIANKERLTDGPITGGKLGSGNWDSYGVMMYDDSNYFLRLANTVTDKNFTSFFSFVNYKAQGAGKYLLSLDLKATGATENIGIRVAGNGLSKDIRIVDTTDNLYESLEDSTVLVGWKKYSVEVNLSAADILKADSVQMWNNTQGIAGNYVDIDNLSVKKVTDADMPTLEKDSVEYSRNGSEGDIVVGIDTKGGTIESIKYGRVEAEISTDYTFADGKITLKKSFLTVLAAGENDITITTKKGTSIYDVVLSVTVLVPRPEIPDLSDLLEEETLLGGNFEDKALNSTLSKDVDANGWGSHQNDYPSKFVDVDGSRVMMIGKTVSGAKDWASCFVMTNPIINVDDTVKFEFDYKLSFADKSIYDNLGVAFVGPSGNSDMYNINLLSQKEQCDKGNGKYQWDTTHTDKGNGWIRVSMTFVAEQTWSLKTDSIRFLMRVPSGAPDSDAAYIDNVSLIRYTAELTESEAPVFTSSDATYDKNGGNNLEMSVNLKGYNINKILVNGTQIEAANFSYEGTDNTVLTIKKEYLATLENGEYTFTVSTLGGTSAFKVIVKNTTIPPTEGLPVGAIIGICVGGVAVLGGGAFALYWFVFRKKK